MRRLNKREFAILVVCVALLLVFAARQWIVLPMLQSAGSIDDQIRVAQARLAKARGVLLLKPKVEGRYQRLVEVIGVAGSDAQEMSLVVYKVQAVANQANVHIANIQPQHTIVQETVSFFPVELEISGQWRNIAQFLYSLQSAPHYYFIDDLSLEKGADPSGMLSGRVTISRIRLIKIDYMKKFPP